MDDYESNRQSSSHFLATILCTGFFAFGTGKQCAQMLKYKVAQVFSKVAKIQPSLILLKICCFSKKPQKSLYIWKKICSQDLSEIAQTNWGGRGPVFKLWPYIYTASNVHFVKASSEQDFQLYQLKWYIPKVV